MSREEFIKSLGLLTVSGMSANTFFASCTGKPTSEASSVTSDVSMKELFFKISLAEWSLHKTLFAKEFENLEFPARAKNEFGISAVEYVNQFFMDKAKNTVYLSELKKRADDVGVTNVLIMCDGEGEMASLNAKKRMEAVENHYKWVDAARFLGCHSIRVNCFGIGTAEEVAKAGADGLRKLSEYAQPAGINVIVENHGGYSSNGQWLTNVMKEVGMTNCGILPDFGNFCIKRGEGQRGESTCIEEYDRYQGVEEMMPFAKGVSAKSGNFDAEGNCTDTDFARMLAIVKAAGYTGYIGIEYEGGVLSEAEGIKATKVLLERVGGLID
jgi:sugar phosphate isomerase/epimerase